MLNPSEGNVKEKIEKSKRNVKEKVKKDAIIEMSIQQIEHQAMLKKIQEELVQKFKDYRTTLNYMAADAPIETLCLPKPIETALLINGFLRIYDVFDVDFAKIKGLGVVRIRQLAASLDQFFSML
ncbi:hypothetical protein UFOVP264_2 [uncultured Caudovirales phage]|uniref:Uncharacterized protein n=1 Tax=uncultured Caudovirales phage TaxID=2100421 RepID=A0A6J5LGC0_9CAUD|nr:hypothetical protein UFOVP264_2 [uncultured Caudovirales phage]